MHDNDVTLTIYSYELVMNVHMIFQQLNESHRDQLEMGVCAIEEEEGKQGERGPLQSGLGGSHTWHRNQFGNWVSSVVNQLQLSDQLPDINFLSGQSSVHCWRY
jgi:O-succinylbenzoate synthase